jgi:uncharacterized protein
MRARKPNRARAALVILAVLLCTGPASAVTFPEKPPKSDWFVDSAELIDPTDRENVNELAKQLFGEHRIPIYAVTIRSLAAMDASSRSIEGYARELFDHWGIGSQDRNVGMLLLVSLGDRKARIELGADWGGRHDAAAASVMQDLIVPAFKRGDYSTGIVAGVRGMDAMGRGLGLPRPTAPWWFLPAGILGGIAFIALIVNLFRTGRSGWAWALLAGVAALLFFIAHSASSGSGGGSGGGLGGGSGGGGGASGGW